MTLKDFKINALFFTHTGQWMCTDIGTRTITAVDYQNYLESEDKTPPYSIVEHSFDEYDIEGCWRAEELEGVDSASLVVVSQDGFGLICKDKNNIYRNDERLQIKGSIEHYVSLNECYAKDDCCAYYKGSEIEGVDIASFEAIIHDFAKDKNCVFYYGHAMKEIDVKSFEYLQEGLYKDKDSLFFGSCKVEDIDVKDFELLANHIGRTKDRLFHFDQRDYTVREIEEVDLSTLHFIGQSYLRDGDFDHELHEGVWRQQAHDVMKLRRILSYKYGAFFGFLEGMLFEEDLMNIAQEGFEDEYAGERDEILMVIDDIRSVETLNELIILIFKERFDAAALKVEKERYRALAEKIWIAYWYTRGEASART